MRILRPHREARGGSRVSLQPQPREPCLFAFRLLRLLGVAPRLLEPGASLHMLCCCTMTSWYDTMRWVHFGTMMVVPDNRTEPSQEVSDTQRTGRVLDHEGHRRGQQNLKGEQNLRSALHARGLTGLAGDHTPSRVPRGQTHLPASCLRTTHQYLKTT